MSLRQNFNDSLKAVKANILPGFVLQIISIAIIVSYYSIPQAKDFWEWVASAKNKGGILLAMCSTAIFGGLIPGLIQQFSPTRRQPALLNYLMFLILFWAYKGAEVDCFYILQAYLFGNNNEVLTVIFKVLMDEFIYTPLLGAYSIVLVFEWRKNQYTSAFFKASMNLDWYRAKVFPLLVSNWLIWIPSVSIIYCLPLSLQLPVQNLILCFWSLIVMFFSSANEVSKN